MKKFSHYIFVGLLLILMSACDFSGEERAKAQSKALTLLTASGWTDVKFVRGGAVVQEASMICTYRGYQDNPMFPDHFTFIAKRQGIKVKGVICYDTVNMSVEYTSLIGVEGKKRGDTYMNGRVAVTLQDDY